MSRFKKTHRDSWEEWKKLCAIDKCGIDAMDNLGTYGSEVFSRLWRKFNPDIGLPFESKQDCWRHFESYMHTTSGNTGKRWKDWLFEKAESSNDDFVTVLEKVVYDCMRTVVIKLCSNEGQFKAFIAKVRLTHLDAPLSPLGDSHATIGATVSAPDDTRQNAAWNQLCGMAREVANDLFLTLDRKSRAALLADHLKISLGESAVEKLAGAKKTTLYSRLKETEQQAEATLQKKYSTEDPSTLQDLLHLTKEALGAASFRWGKSEKLAEPLFTLERNRMNS